MEGAPDGGKLAQKRAVSRCIGRTKGGLNSKLHAVCDGSGKPVALLLSEGQMSDYRGAALRLDSWPKATELLADRGYDADWFRAAFIRPGITPCIPPKKNRKQSLEYDKALYKQRHKIENLFGKLKDWRRIAMRYDRCAPLSSPPSASLPLISSQFMSPEPSPTVVLVQEELASA